MTTNAFRCLGCSKRCEASYYDMDRMGYLYEGAAIDHICDETGRFTDWWLMDNGEGVE